MKEVTQTENEQPLRILDAQLLQAALYRAMEALSPPPAEDGFFVDLPLLQIKCLKYIAAHPGQKLGELAQRLQVALPGVSRIVEKLVIRGFVERLADPDDHRAKRLRLTPEAQKAMEDRRERWRKHLIDCTAQLSNEELHHIRKEVELLAATTEAAMPVSELDELRKKGLEVAFQLKTDFPTARSENLG